MVNTPPNRPWTPQAPAVAYTTYELSAPAATHRRRATCAEVNCPQYLKGWSTTVQAGSDDEAILLRGCRGEVDQLRRNGRRIPQADGFVQYVFEPGQPCFRASAHTVHNDRDPIAIRRDGDHRGNPTGELTVHTRLDDWVEDFGEHQAGLSDEAQKG